MTTWFQERVWEQHGNGLWSSRIATQKDHARRRLIVEMLDSNTSPERKEEIRKQLAEML